jgi:hypothetical protein
VQSIKELNGSVSSFFKFFNLKLSVIVAVVPLKYLYLVLQANNKISKTDANDSSGEEDLAVYHLEVTRNDLCTRIAKEVSVVLLIFVCLICEAQRVRFIWFVA